MSLTPVRRTDPFDFPPSIIPLGLKYQWCAKTVCGGTVSQYDFLQRGWLPVPAQWHPGVWDIASGSIEIGGQVLMCHAAARDEEADRIAGANKNIEDWMARTGAAGLSGGVRIWSDDSERLPPITVVGDNLTAKKIIAITPDFEYSTNESKQRKPRYNWLTWLFNLISTEIEL